MAGDHIDVIKLLPPLLVGDEELEWFVAAFDDVMEDVHSSNGLFWEFGLNLVKHAITRR